MHLQAHEMQKIVTDLASRDPKLAKVIAAHPMCTLAGKPNTVSNFESLVESVVSQQLSVKAADTIYGRLVALCGTNLSPEPIVELSDEAMREAGLSGAKVKTIRGLAQASISGSIDFENLHLIEEDAVISTQLNALWGIGPWTVDMFMMHQLHRLDVWPTGDLGVRRGWQNMFELEQKVEAAELGPLGESFRPYRSILAWYCWRAA